MVLFQYLIYFFLKALLWLRYRIDVQGLDEVAKAKKKGVVFLPNHPAEMDPVILISILWGQFRPRPLIVEHFFYKKGLRFFIDLLVKALPLPTMDVGNEWKKRQVEKLKAKILSRTKEQGQNFMVYPSGRLKSSGEERLGGASLVYQLLQMDPDMDFVLVRTTGLWGSTYSRAITGFSPDFGSVTWKGFWIVLKNFIFFTPRRRVTVEFARPGEDFPRRGEKMQINEWLENWYNKEGEEPLKLVSFSRWKRVFPKITAQEESKAEEVVVSEDVKVQILGFLSKLTKQSVTDAQTDLHLSNDLGLDSLDISQINVFLEERFDITGLAPGQLQTVHDIMQAAAGVKKESEEPVEREKKSRWPKEKLARKAPEIAEGETIQEVFLNSCERMGDTIACADALSGVLTYNKLKRAAMILSLEIREMPGEHIGVLLPSTVGAYVTILAVLLAGKVPVMLNWTTGFRNLEHAADVCSLQVVLSSYRFLSRLDVCDLGKVDDLLVLLENVRSNIKFKNKLKGLYLHAKSTKALLKKLPKPKDTAVVIFTSGTETLPKGVPLSHENLLSNQRAALSCVEFKANDRLYGVLPPFHSFGFSVTGLAPLLFGLRVCYAPDPTDSRGIADDIEHWGATIFCCAPSFIQAMLRVASSEQLKSIRLMVSGAEKAPQELYDTLRAKKISFLEGYGISECSPIVTIQREGEPAVGVGKPIPGVELCLIEKEGNEGEVCISGPNVFSGYLGVKKDPFIELDGKKWYRSGDRGLIDSNGNLTITGRLTRFIKIGGEMVSLGGLEEDLIAISRSKGWAPKKENGPLLAVAAHGFESEKPQIVLFTTFDADREEINRSLRETGLGRLVKIAEIRKLEEIPLTGTGKVHYRLLDEML
ncbi:MAG: AMP-binding protein [Simkaniaceae bacterium]|nr:AMP-binding protein [Candidatus Sacchlamyda saccharinae]